MLLTSVRLSVIKPDNLKAGEQARVVAFPFDNSFYLHVKIAITIYRGT